MLLRSLGIILLSLTALIEPAFAQARLPFVGRVTTDRVYIRAGQNVNFETVATVKTNDTLIVLEDSYGWLKVKLPADAKAYIKAEYVDQLTPEVGSVKADRVNIRCAASTTATVIGKLVRGNRFYIKAKEGDWLAIKPLDQFTGWVKKEFVEPKRGAAVPAVLYPEPLAATAVVPPVPPAPPAAAAVPPAPEKPFLLKKLSNGQVEAAGILKKEDSLYRIYRDKNVVCIVEGPAAALDSFVNHAVKVRGKLKEAGAQPGADPVVSLAKISFSL